MNEIRDLSSMIHAVFKHVGRSANGFADSLAKPRVERSSDFVAFHFVILFVGIMLLYLSIPLSLL